MCVLLLPLLGQTLAVGLKVAVKAAFALTFLACLPRHIVVVLFFEKIICHKKYHQDTIDDDLTLNLAFLRINIF